MAPVRWEPAGQ